MSAPALTRPFLAVAVTGPPGDGKTSLVSALLEYLTHKTKHQVRPVPLDVLIQGGEPLPCKLSTRLIELTEPYETIFVPQSRADVVILVVAQHRELPRRIADCLGQARAYGSPQIVVFLNKCEQLEEPVRDSLELKVREQLDVLDLDGDAAVIIRGSAKRALEHDARWLRAVGTLIDTLDHQIPLPSRVLDPPEGRVFQFFYNQTSDPEIPGQSFKTHGTREIKMWISLSRGTVREGDRLSLVTPFDRAEVDVLSVDDATFATAYTEGVVHPGQYAWITVRAERALLKEPFGALLTTPERSRELFGSQVFDAVVTRVHPNGRERWPPPGEAIELGVALGEEKLRSATLLRVASMDEELLEDDRAARVRLELRRPIVLPEGARFFFADAGGRGFLGFGVSLGPRTEAPTRYRRWTAEDELRSQQGIEAELNMRMPLLDHDGARDV